MKTLKSLLLLLILPCLTFAQASIVCPSDVTVHGFDLDDKYESYGDPIIMNQGNLELDMSISVIDNACQTAFAQNTTITYTLKDPTSNSSVATCNQKIDIIRPTLNDIVFPDSLLFVDDAWVGDAPQIPGETISIGDFNILSTYNDQVLPDGVGGIKIIRTYTYLDWCTGDTVEFFQIIRVNNLIGQSNIGTVLNCDTGEDVQFDGVIVSTDAPGVSIDQTTCTVGGGDLATYFNCVVAANPIPDGFNYSIQVIKEGDDLNGISTLDLVMIQRHILGIKVLDSPCKEIAADISNNSLITALDLVEMRKLILGFYPEIPASSSWKFVDGQALASGNLDLPEKITITKEAFPIDDLNVVAIKIGDVNGSAIIE